MSARKRNAFLGFSADIGGMLLIQLLSLALIPFYLKYISLQEYGYWLVILSVIGWIGIADFGIGVAVTRFLIKAMNGEENEDENIGRVINTGLFIFLITALLFFAVGVGVFSFFPRWFHLQKTAIPVFFAAFIIALVSNTFIIPFALFGGMLEAKQKMALNRNIQTTGLVIQFLSSIVLVIFFKNIIGLAVSLLVGSIVSCLLQYYFATRHWQFKISRAHISKPVFKEMFSFGGYFQLGRTANLVATSTDSLFIASFININVVPVYNFTAKLPLLFCNSIASKVALSMFSGLAQVFDQGSVTLFRDTFRRLFAVMLRLAFFTAILIFFVNEKFVEAWVGKANFGGAHLNMIFVYWVFFETIIRGTGIVIQISGQLKGWAISAIIESLVNIGLSFYFLYIGWGIFGLALATAIARTFTIGVYWVRFLAQKKLLSLQELLAFFGQNFLRSIPVFIVLYGLSAVLKIENPILVLLIYPVIGLIVNAVCYDWTILKNALQTGSFRVLYNGYKQRY